MWDAALALSSMSLNKAMQNFGATMAAAALLADAIWRSGIGTRKLRLNAAVRLAATQQDKQESGEPNNGE